MLVAKTRAFEFEIEGDSKIVIDCYNKKLIFLVPLFY